ncbi:MAG: hypothetical protein OXQ94_16220 [Gemmatimonadota bacterium]|nr:hypothetical protein [Gemmatimonadota bacterium]MDE2873225.1 hypothetical protein [Gemmatimonadota bacterium]
MIRRDMSAISAAVAVAAAGCGGPGGPTPADTLTYGVPSPPSAVYHIADTMSIEVQSPFGGTEITGEGSVTIALAFRPDPGGVRVVGTVEAFDGSMAHPMMGTQTAGPDDLSGDLEVVVGRTGVEELVSFPELSGAVAQVSSFPALAYILFSRMPPGDADPGATWVDTVASLNESMGASTSTTAIGTYTLLGDTVVDGRNLVHIAVANEVVVESTFEEGGMSVTQSSRGSTDGHVLWDPERRLVARAEYERDVAGTMSMGGMGSMDMAVKGPTRIRLER